MAKPIIHSTKHYKQDPLFIVVSGSVTTKTIVNAVAVDNKDAVNEVEEGAIVKAVYLEYWITGDDDVFSSHISVLEKLQNGASTITSGQIATLHAYVNKKNVFYTTMGLVPPKTQYPMQLVKQWFPIPKGKQRMGLGDKITFSIFGQVDGLQACGFSTYKEYT